VFRVTVGIKLFVRERATDRIINEDEDDFSELHVAKKFRI
jgi:hypothetical protein